MAAAQAPLRLLAGLALAAPSALGLHLGLGGSVSPAVLETMQALDTDGSGHVERQEIEAFARSQGADVAKAVSDFYELDRDHSGYLDLDEIAGTVVSASDSTAASVAQPPPAVPVDQAPVLPAGDGIVRSELEAVPLAIADHHQKVLQEVARPPAAAGTLSATSLLESAVGGAERFAAKASAEAFTRRAEQLMQRREADEAKAAELENLARTLRQNATALLGSAVTESQRATREAAEGVVAVAMGKVRDLEREAGRADSDAQKELKLAEEAASRAARAQAELSESVHRLRRRLTTQDAPMAI
eukprot:TRINITY_DN73319_c0_g1_i1.p1 TRINITY_DN73319_c0_g1~~TRINITY_DN73319_c0_g1_i1.p1  ORF type:complete len:335 (-),score=82.38 TRINITY_DN73319_c0_g1_i1:55-960(-)